MILYYIRSEKLLPELSFTDRLSLFSLKRFEHFRVLLKDLLFGFSIHPEMLHILQLSHHLRGNVLFLRLLLKQQLRWRTVLVLQSSYSKLL